MISPSLVSDVAKIELGPEETRQIFRGNQEMIGLESKNQLILLR